MSDEDQSERKLPPARVRVRQRPAEAPSATSVAPASEAPPLAPAQEADDSPRTANTGRQRDVAKPKRDYAVGYGKPPRHTQFKKGQVANPKGRGPGRKDDATLMEEIFGEPMEVRIRGRQTRRPFGEVIWRKVAYTAFAKSSLPHLDRCLALLAKKRGEGGGGGGSGDSGALSLPADDLEIIEDFLRRMSAEDPEESA